MADWNQPQLSSLYTNVLNNLKDRDVDSATLFQNAPTNPVSGFIRFNRVTNVFEEWNGTSWVVKVLSLSGGGTGANDAAGARTNLELGSMALQNSNAVAIVGGTISGLTSLGVSGTITAGLFSGSGASLTNIPNSATSATNLNSPNTIVSRDGGGNFNAGTITANLVGNASTVTNGVYTTGSYDNPAWITGLDATKINTGTLSDTRLSSNVVISGGTYDVITRTNQALATLYPYNTLPGTTYLDLTANTELEIFSYVGSGFSVEGTKYDYSGNDALIKFSASPYSPPRTKLNSAGEYLIAVHVTFEVNTAGFLRLRIEDAEGDTGAGNVIGRSEAYSQSGYVVLNCIAHIYATSAPRYVRVVALSTVDGNKIASFEGQRSMRLSIQKVW